MNLIKGLKKIIKVKAQNKKLKHFGKLCEISRSVDFIFQERLSIGDYVYIGPNGQINAMGNVSISSNVIIGPNVLILSANHNFRQAACLPYDEKHVLIPVVISENVWIGANVIITPGSTIGEGSIIGAGCVVSGKIPPLSVVVGNPCKVISSRDDEHYYHLKSQEKSYLKEKKYGNLKPNTGREDI